MLQICLWHLNSCLGFMHRGYVAVDFYFVLSGFLLYRSCKKEKSKSILDYSLCKIKLFAPRIFFAFLIFGYASKEIITKVPDSVINDILMISASGWVPNGGANGPLWYISVLIIGGGLIYALLKRYEIFSLTIVLPLTILLVYTFILTQNNYSLEYWETVGCFHIPLWRGIAGMSLGCVLFRIHKLKGNLINNEYKRIFDLLSVISLILIFTYAYTDLRDDAYVLLFVSLIVLSAFSADSLLNKILTHNFWLFLGRLSLDMYIIHFFIVKIVEDLKVTFCPGIGNLVYVFLYLSILLSCSYIFNFLYTKYFYKFLMKFF